MKSVAFAFVFSGLYPAAFLCAKDAPSSAIAQSTSADSASRAIISTAQVSAVKAEDYADMALIPGGEFAMGSADGEGYPSEHPRHKVFLAPYYIDKYEVTVTRYRIFAEAVGKQLRRQPFPDKDNCPMVYISWHDALAYCGYYGKRLPTEAEWEMAARGGSNGKYCFGSDEKRLGEYAWYWDNSGRRIHPVGQKKPNRYGIYDLHGNVLEWAADWHSGGYYAESPAANPAGPAEGSEKVIRGGSSFVTADLCRSAHRMKSSPDTGYSGKGFRCAAQVTGIP